MSKHGLRSRTDRQTFFQYIAACLGYPRKLRIEALDMILLFLEKALWNEHREIGVAVAGSLKAAVHFLLDVLPDFVAFRFEDDTAADR
ncbi:hypothetical protein D3C75_896920 [compost metagenome]